MLLRKINTLRICIGVLSLLIVISVALYAKVPSGCNTPVFRYALEHCQPDHNEVVVLHHPLFTAAQNQLLETLQWAIDNEDSPAKVTAQALQKQTCRAFPDQHGDGMQSGPKRNYQILPPLDFLAEFTQHIPATGAHLIRYYGWYSNKSRGMRQFKDSTEVAEKALDELTKAGRGSWEAIGPGKAGGRPTRRFRLAPTVHVYETPPAREKTEVS